jgi:RNA polymerase sigma-70 factor (ECF subfamily)
MSNPAFDADDMHALRRGDDAALDRLMVRWQVPLRRFLFRHTQNEADALDLAQETFVRVYRSRDRFAHGARFSTWLFAIALNLARDAVRHHKRRPSTPLDQAPEPSHTHHPLSEADTHERAAAVRNAIAELPSDLRAAVVLFEYENMSHAEIADIVGASPKAVETRIYRARQQLRKTLSHYLQHRA